MSTGSMSSPISKRGRKGPKKVRSLSSLAVYGTEVVGIEVRRLFDVDVNGLVGRERSEARASNCKGFSASSNAKFPVCSCCGTDSLLMLIGV